MIHRLLEAMGALLREEFSGVIPGQRVVVGAEPEKDINLYAGELTSARSERTRDGARSRVTCDIAQALVVAVGGSDRATAEEWAGLALAAIATERDRLLVTFNQYAPYERGTVSSACQLDQLDFRGIQRVADMRHEMRFVASGRLLLERAVEGEGVIETVTVITRTEDP